MVMARNFAPTHACFENKNIHLPNKNIATHLMATTNVYKKKRLGSLLLGQIVVNTKLS
jgi:hypothetical protein